MHFRNGCRARVKSAGWREKFFFFFEGNTNLFLLGLLMQISLTEHLSIISYISIRSFFPSLYCWEPHCCSSTHTHVNFILLYICQQKILKHQIYFSSFILWLNDHVSSSFSIFIIIIQVAPLNSQNKYFKTHLC